MEARNLYLKNALFLLFDDNENSPEKAGKILAKGIQCAVDVLHPVRDDRRAEFNKSIKGIKRKWLHEFIKSLIENLVELRVEEKL